MLICIESGIGPRKCRWVGGCLGGLLARWLAGRLVGWVSVWRGPRLSVGVRVGGVTACVVLAPRTLLKIVDVKLRRNANRPTPHYFTKG